MQSENQCFDEHIFRLFSLSVLSYVIYVKIDMKKIETQCEKIETQYIASLHELYDRYVIFFALRVHLFWPDAALDFSDVSLVKEEHTQTALSDTASD